MNGEGRPQVRFSDLVNRLLKRREPVESAVDMPAVPALSAMTRTRFVREHLIESSAGPVDVALEEALWRIGWVHPEELEDVATQLLSEGHDGPALVDIAAGLTDRYEADKVFSRALREMGREPSSTGEAGLRVARHIAAKVVSGGLSPDSGVGLFTGLYWDLEMPSWLSTMYALEDDLSEVRYRHDLDADCIRRQIVNEAQALLKSTTVEG